MSRCGCGRACDRACGRERGAAGRGRSDAGLWVGLGLLMIASVGLDARAGAEESTAAAESGAVPRYPVSAFFGRNHFDEPDLSPDGKHIAFRMRRGDVDFVMVRETEGGELLPVAELDDPELRFNWLAWANDDRVFVGVHAMNKRGIGVRARYTRFFSIDRSGKEVKILGAPDRRSKVGGVGKMREPIDVIHGLPDDPHHVLVHYSEPESRGWSVKRMNVYSGAVNHVQSSRPEVGRWFADLDGHVRAGSKRMDARYSFRARVDESGDFEEMAEFEMFEENGAYFGGFSRDPGTVYVYKDVDRRRAVFEFDLEKKELGKLVFSHPEYDAAGLRYDPAWRRLVAVGYTTDIPQLHYVDAEAEREQGAIDRALPGTLNRIHCVSNDRMRAIVRAESDVQPPQYYLFLRDTQPKRMDFLLDTHPKLRAEHLSPMKPVSYSNRDGQEVRGYLTVPKWRVPKSLPVIVLPHGGPTSRDVLGFDAEVQFLANRGFAVFQMNYRGSSGYGDAWQVMGYREWGGAMQDDIEDGVRWLIAEGIADPDRIGIYGSSYGGYAALMGLVKTPELFRAGASYAGVTSLSMMLSDDEWYRDWEDLNRPMVGGGWGDKARLRKNSPLDRASEIQDPVLLAHGTEDSRVHVKHSKKMAKALKKAGKSVEYLEFEHEIHGFASESSALAFYERLGAFFQEHLAPRPAPATARND